MGFQYASTLSSAGSETVRVVGSAELRTEVSGICAERGQHASTSHSAPPTTISAAISHDEARILVIGKISRTEERDEVARRLLTLATSKRATSPKAEAAAEGPPPH